jgi:hypothetical protein
MAAVNLYYPLSPVHEVCSACNGFGRGGDAMCWPCDGIGRVWIDGGPSFGCKMRLATRKVGEVVTLGNGDRGRIIRHCRRGEPSTEIAIIDEMTEEEAEVTTSYPGTTGVRSTLPAGAKEEDAAGRSRTRRDQLDPLQRDVRPL